MNWLLEHWQWMLAGAGALIVLAWLTSRRRSTPREAKQNQADLDAKLPARRW